MAFVDGTGNPPTPPATGFVQSLDVDLFDCGWLFVRTSNGGMAAVQTGSYGSSDELNGGHYLTLSYGEMTPLDDQP
ncbi:MAG: hypothetical protein ACR2FK_01705 [Sphingomicrobium sp.]